MRPAPGTMLSGTHHADDLQVATDKYPMPARDNVISCSDDAGDIAEVGEGLCSEGARRCETKYSELASLDCTAATVWNELFGNVQLKPGLTVLVQAAGATTIITSSSNDKLQKGSRARELVGQQGVDHILEIGGIGTIEQSIEALAFGGHISVIGYLANVDPSNMPNVLQLALRKAAVIRGILIGPKCVLEELATFADRRKLRLPVEKKFGFAREEVLKAYQELETRALGKVCIRVD
ncbi:hypothetical protein BDW60DRAFT_220648 [Aspergillus nidulans var. acristatus]